MLWVQEAQKDHYDFVLKMKERGVDVLDLHDVLERTLESKEARAFVLDRRVTVNAVGVGIAEVMRPWLDAMPAKKLAEHLIGGIAVSDLPDSEMRAHMTEAYSRVDFVLPPIPNTLFQRDPSCWIYGGVSCNPMYWPARRPERLLQRAVARALFASRAATRVIGCLMPKSRAAMHLDTVFTFCDRDLVTIFRDVVDQIRCYSARPIDDRGGFDLRKEEKPLLDVVAEALELPKLRVVETGGDAWEARACPRQASKSSRSVPRSWVAGEAEVTA